MSKNVAKQLREEGEHVRAQVKGGAALAVTASFNSAARAIEEAISPEDWARVREIRDGAVMTDRREAALTRVLDAFAEEES